MHSDAPRSCSSPTSSIATSASAPPSRRSAAPGAGAGRSPWDRASGPNSRRRARSMSRVPARASMHSDAPRSCSSPTSSIATSARARRGRSVSSMRLAAPLKPAARRRANAVASVMVHSSFACLQTALRLALPPSSRHCRPIPTPRPLQRRSNRPSTSDRRTDDAAGAELVEVALVERRIVGTGARRLGDDVGVGQLLQARLRRRRR
jgi:hypothetical protein